MIVIKWVIVMIIVLVVGCGGESPATQSAEESNPKGTIDDNLAAGRHVKVSMTSAEVSSMIEGPKTPWTNIALKLREPSDIWGIKLAFRNRPGDALFLTPIGADIVDSPFYAWIFFPTVSGASRPTMVFGASRPTMVFFTASTDTVLHVQQYQCDDVLKTLAVGGQHTDVPKGSACHP
jgi:hypothetical protein